MRKTVSGIILILLLMGMLTLAFNIQPVKASPGTIYIRADGSVEGTTSIQTADNVTYVFTANINASLVVERNNIIIDGNGYTLQGTGEYLSKGVDLSGRTNVTAHNATIKAFYYGIWLDGSSNNTVSGNNITANNGLGVRLDSSSGNTLSGNNFTANWDGIVLDSSSGNTLSGNNVTANSGKGIWVSYNSNYNVLSDNNVTANGSGGVIIYGYGIYLYFSFNNVLSGNNVANNWEGIWLQYSSNNVLSGNNVTANNYLGIILFVSPGNTLSGNVMGGNGHNFAVGADALYGDVLSQYLQSVDTSNLVDGKPVYYFVNQSDIVVNADAYPEVGYLAFVNCVNVTAQGLNLTNNYEGLLLAFTNDSKITGNNVTNNDVGIYLYFSFNNVLSGNNVTANNGDGIDLHCSNYNALSGNTVTANDAGGIWLASSSNNTLSGNNFTANSGMGIWVSYNSNYNVLSDNNVANNDVGIYFYVSFGNTLSGNNVTANSYGISLSSSDYNTLSDNNVANNWRGIQLGHEVGLGYGSNPSNYNVLSGNNVTANNEDGIVLAYSSGNALSGNNVTNNGYGIRLYYSLDNTLSSNVMGSNQYNFGVDGHDLGFYLQSVDASNLVDGKPVYYFVNQSDLVVNADAYPEVGYLAFVNCVNVTAQGLNLTSNGQGLLLAFTNDSKITGNNVTNNWDGIVLDHSYNNTLFGNNVTANNWDGIYLFTSSGNALSGNNIANNNNCGVVLESSSNLNSISGNNITANNWCGIWLTYFSNNNMISGNNITANNGYGIVLSSSNNNMIYHNNFIDNHLQVSSGTSMNVWDDGYPSGGNYWSDYSGVDLKNGPGQNQTGSDGIGDARYKIDENNIDGYPLMCLFNRFDAGTWSGVAYSVGVVSNSTVSGFSFNPEAGPFIRFNATGSSGTIGFSRVAIPKQLLCVKPPAEWIVEIGGVQVTPTVTEDANYTYLYFTYTHSTKTIQITGTNVVPEFPPATTMLLLMIFTLLAVAFAKKRLPRPKSGNHHFSLSSR